MARPTKDKQRIPVSGSVLPEIAAELEAIAIKKYRTKSQIIELLLVRGLAAYNRDGELAEPMVETAGITEDLPKKPKPAKKEYIAVQNDFLMSDPKGKNAGTKRLPKAIQRDIDYAKAEVEKAKREQRS